MIIFGASGHGKVIASIVGKNIPCFFDDDETIKEFINIQVLPYNASFMINELLVVAIGDNKIRKKVVSRIEHNFGIVQHTSALVDDNVLIDIGTQIIHGSIIQTGCSIGKHTILNTSASIDHDCIIGDFCHIAPRVTICGNVRVGEGTLIGAGATIIPGVNIGKWTIIGAGTVVIQDVPDYATVVGNPGKKIKINE
jgi:sugar O-acyltransferase (sialic acid O-acetyltransferase NeuD family)